MNLLATSSADAFVPGSVDGLSLLNGDGFDGAVPGFSVTSGLTSGLAGDVSVNSSTNL
jgi:hypothetical protein